MASKIHKECFPEHGWVVFGKLRNIASAHEFLLAGGTALAIRKGHRISYDLDFFTLRRFRNDKLISEIRRVTRDFKVIAEEEGMLTLVIEGVKVSFLRHEYPFADEILDIEGTGVAGVLDIAAMTVIAINQRGVKRDFVDLYTILQEIPFHRIAAHMVRRFGKERINPVHMGKSFVYFADADTNPDPAYRPRRELQWNDIKKFFREHAKQFVLDLEVATKAADRPSQRR